MNDIDALQWLEPYCRELFRHMLERAIEQYCLDSGKIEAKVIVRQEAKEGVEDDLAENEKKYRLSSYAKGFPFGKWAKMIVEAGREKRQSQQTQSQ